MRVLSVILARAGSRGLKDKHLLPLLGRPVISYTFDFARPLKERGPVVVSSDCAEVRKLGGLFATPLVNPSPLGGQERIGLYTTFVGSGTLFYYLTIVPEKEAATFAETFQKIGQSIKLNDAAR